jgi:hypothetical protein
LFIVALLQQRDGGLAAILVFGRGSFSGQQANSVRRVALGHLAVLTALLAAPVSMAQAADMPLKAQPAVAAPLPYSWAGFYVGAQGGFGWGHAEDTDATPFDSGRFL